MNGWTSFVLAYRKLRKKGLEFLLLQNKRLCGCYCVSIAEAEREPKFGCTMSLPSAEKNPLNEINLRALTSLRMWQFWQTKKSKWGSLLPFPFSEPSLLRPTNSNSDYKMPLEALPVSRDCSCDSCCPNQESASRVPCPVIGLCSINQPCCSNLQIEWAKLGRLRFLPLLLASQVSLPLMTADTHSWA